MALKAWAFIWCNWLWIDEITIAHYMVGLGSASTEQSESGILVGYYSSRLLFALLYRNKTFERRYGEGVGSVTLKVFQTYATHICNEV